MKAGVSGQLVIGPNVAALLGRPGESAQVVVCLIIKVEGCGDRVDDLGPSLSRRMW